MEDEEALKSCRRLAFPIFIKTNRTICDLTGLELLCLFAYLLEIYERAWSWTPQSFCKQDFKPLITNMRLLGLSHKCPKAKEIKQMKKNIKFGMKIVSAVNDIIHKLEDKYGQKLYHKTFVHPSIMNKQQQQKQQQQQKTTLSMKAKAKAPTLSTVTTAANTSKMATATTTTAATATTTATAIPRKGNFLSRNARNAASNANANANANARTVPVLLTKISEQMLQNIDDSKSNGNSNSNSTANANANANPTTTTNEPRSIRIRKANDANTRSTNISASTNSHIRTTHMEPVMNNVNNHSFVEEENEEKDIVLDSHNHSDTKNNHTNNGGAPGASLSTNGGAKEQNNDSNSDNIVTSVGMTDGTGAEHDIVMTMNDDQKQEPAVVVIAKNNDKKNNNIDERQSKNASINERYAAMQETHLSKLRTILEIQNEYNDTRLQLQQDGHFKAKVFQSTQVVEYARLQLKCIQSVMHQHSGEHMIHKKHSQSNNDLTLFTNLMNWLEN